SLFPAEPGTPPPPPPTPPTPPPPPPPPPTETAAPEEHTTRPRRVIAYAAAGLGVAGLAAGPVFTIEHRNKRGNADALCPDQVCMSTVRTQIQGFDHDADQDELISIVSFSVGAAAVVAAGILYFVSGGSSPKADTKSTAVEWQPWVGDRAAG